MIDNVKSYTSRQHKDNVFRKEKKIYQLDLLRFTYCVYL